MNDLRAIMEIFEDSLVQLEKAIELQKKSIEYAKGKVRTFKRGG